ncbi:Uridine-cytidine kinase-like 1 [Chytriomyces hyalinus]|nr:Uridine-cytidine kinase-like 1 [Chytriomyces hyalinus]KAJ3252492.1 Uridine-cytidine kinase-like 1 [Chytriomyces hyalinus]
MGDSGGGITDGDQKLKRGRFPWFSLDGTPHKPYIIGIGGGSASGKTSVANIIIKELGVPWVVLVQMDSFYKSLTKEQIEQAYQNNYNFDHPDSFDFDILEETLKNLKDGVQVDVPVYDFNTHSRLKDTSTSIYGANIVIFEGIFALHDPKVRELMDLMLFVDTDSDVRLARRLRRDIAERGRDIHGVLSQYKKFVKPAFDDYIYPTMKHADVIVPRGSDNVAAISVITQHIIREMDARDLSLRSQLLKIKYPKEKPDSVALLDQNPEVASMLLLLQDKSLDKSDFAFNVDRLSRLVVERGLVEYELSQEANVEGVLKLHQKMCAVEVTRTKGPSMLRGLTQVLNHLPLGSIMLVQTRDVTSPKPSSEDSPTSLLAKEVAEIELHHMNLPKDIKDRVVIITDVTTSTGAAAMMAVRVVLDHGVKEKNIIFLSLVATAHGLHVLTNAFPAVKIATAEVVSEIDDGFRRISDIGHFGDRSFADLGQA